MDEKVRKLEEQERNRIKRLENITEQMRVRGKSVHKHNQFSESVFGYLDNYYMSNQISQHFLLKLM